MLSIDLIGALYMSHYKSKTLLDAQGVPHEYRVTPRGAEAGLALLQRLAALLPGLVPVVVAISAARAGKGGSLGDVDLKGAGAALVGALDVDLMKEVLRHTERDGKGAFVDFGTIYQANYGELAEAVAFALDVDFGAALIAMGKQLARMPS